MNEQNIKKLTKNKSRNQLFKTMEDNSKSHALVKNDTSRQKTIQNIMNSNFSKKLSRNNSRKSKLKLPNSIKTRKKSTKAEIDKEVRSMFEEELLKHLQQTDNNDKSSFMDLELGKISCVIVLSEFYLIFRRKAVTRVSGRVFSSSSRANL